MAKLLWSAIVKNEAAIIDRCLDSLLPHIDGAVVVDTGSTDGTPDRIKELFAQALLPVEIYNAPFENFSQARNEALNRARQSQLPWDYALLCDADMELKVHKPNWLNGAKGLSYDLKQTAGAVGYHNRRLVSRHATGQYVGVTHEYLDVATAGALDGAEFLDHADGANRPEKFSRDIALLEKALETETNPGLIQRYHFYLAQSYYDSGNYLKAGDLYQKRVELGGYDEEVWNAQYRYAWCLLHQGFKENFVYEMLKAHQMRPTRAEVAYDLAKYFRERGDNIISLIFSEIAMKIPKPNDQLFINEYVYSVGAKEEFAICAYYHPASRKRGAEVCDEVALSRAASWQSREQARANQYWYLRPLSRYLVHMDHKRIEFEPADGWVAMNPSVINRDGEPLCLIRTVNYTITPEGQYAIRGGDGSYSREHPINTRNYICAMDYELNVEGIKEINLPEDLPEAKYDLVRGFEDSRLFEWHGKRWTLSTVRELNVEGWCEQVLAPIVHKQGHTAYGPWKQILLLNRLNEKNWMPWVRGDDLKFVYRLGTLVDQQGLQTFHQEPKLDTGHISGGTQVTDVDGIYMAVVHEARHIPNSPCRYYQHRFVVLANDGKLLRISPPFCFHDRQVEFAAGLAYFPDKRQLMVSYGVMDREAWVATMDLDDVIAFIAEGS